MKSLIEFIGFILFIIILSFFIKTGCGSDDNAKKKGLKSVFEDIWYGDTTAVDSAGK